LKEITEARANDDLSYEDRVPLPSPCPRLIHVIQTEDIAVHEFVGEDVICLVSVCFGTQESTSSRRAWKQQAGAVEARGTEGGRKLTVLKRFWNREPALADDVEFDLVELLAFDAGAFRDALLGFGKALALV